MKNKIQACIIILFLFVACGVSEQSQIITGTNELDSEDIIAIQSFDKDTCAYSPVLLKEIHSFINKYDDYGMIIAIRAQKRKEQCFLFMSTELYYNSSFLIGYQIVDGKMIAYCKDYLDENTSHYNYDKQYSKIEKTELSSVDVCLSGLIDESKLKNDHPDGYLNENSEDIKYWNYDPVGRRYVIHNQNSLELVFEGCY